MRLRLLCKCFRFDFNLGAFHFGSSLMLSLVKGPLFCFLQMFPKFCVQIYGFGLVFSTKPSSLYYTLIVCYCHVTGDG